jgi:hypothetical protein
MPVESGAFKLNSFSFLRLQERNLGIEKGLQERNLRIEKCLLKAHKNHLLPG